MPYPRALPWQGQPGEPQILYDRDGKPKQERHYGPDGFPLRDIDYDHDHGQGMPHQHDWGRPKDGSPPTHGDRGKGVPVPNVPPPPKPPEDQKYQPLSTRGQWIIG